MTFDLGRAVGVRIPTQSTDETETAPRSVGRRWAPSRRSPGRSFSTVTACDQERKEALMNGIEFGEGQRLNEALEAAVRAVRGGGPDGGGLGGGGEEIRDEMRERAQERIREALRERAGDA